MMEWTKIDEQYVGLVGYEDFVSSDGKRIKRVWHWHDGDEEVYEISE